METIASILYLRGENVQWKSESIDDIYVNGMQIQDYLEGINLNELIKDNILTLTRCFDQRVHAFIKHIVCGPGAPMNVLYYNYRVEFQLRGAAHIHGVIWVDLPALSEKYPLLISGLNCLKEGQVLNVDTADQIAAFIDQFISCDSDNDQKDLIRSVQKHSHSKSCRKYGTSCRFNFPKFPSDRTLIS